MPRRPAPPRSTATGCGPPKAAPSTSAAPPTWGLRASLKDRTGLRHFSLRGLPGVTSEFLFAGIAHNLLLLAAIS